LKSALFQGRAYGHLPLQKCVILRKASAEFYFEKFSSEEIFIFFEKAENFEKCCLTLFKGQIPLNNMPCRYSENYLPLL